MKTHPSFDGIHLSAAKFYVEELGNFTEARGEVEQISEELRDDPVVQGLRDKIRKKEREFWERALKRAVVMTREFPEYRAGRQYREFVERKLRGIGN